MNQTQHQQESTPAISRLAMQTLWPAFIGAIMCAGIVFSLFDPHEASNLPKFFPKTAEGIYTVTFLLLWAVTTLACMATWLLVARLDNKH